MYFHIRCVFVCHRTLCLGLRNFLHLLTVRVTVSKVKGVPPSVWTLSSDVPQMSMYVILGKVNMELQLDAK
jgi:hypothetical protein